MIRKKETEDTRRLDVKTPVGTVTLIGTRTELQEVILPSEARSYSGNVPLLHSSETFTALVEAEAWLRKYFSGENPSWEGNPIPAVPAFHRKVYEALCRVPAGQVVSYQQLAELAGSPKASRAVGQAMAKNPLSIFVPCHRVIGSDGGLHGYGGGLDMKRALLLHEGAKLK